MYEMIRTILMIIGAIVVIGWIISLLYMVDRVNINGFTLKGKSVIVTAASKGLGRAIATEFAHEGAHVLLASRTEASQQETVAAIKQETGHTEVDYAVCDMKDPDTIKSMVEKAAQWNS